MLSDENPALSAQWDREKNGSLTPENTGFCSSRIVWWKCAVGHNWLSTVRNRTYGNGCPYCSGLRAIPGVSDLAARFPDIAAEWDYERNEGRRPSEFTAKSKQKVWWKCGLGHSWQSTVCNRTDKGNGCPYCSGRAPLVGFNDLATKFPGLATEWDYERNGALAPDQVTVKSGRRVWWLCDKGHSWATQISNRSNLKSGCPYCSGLRAIQGVNDLATVNPELAKEWDCDRNDSDAPNRIKAMSSSHSFWWKCEHGHSWQATVAHRTDGAGCPYCSGRLAIPGINDLATTNPALASEWDEDKNGSLRPEDVKGGSTAKVWWRCAKRHSWQAAVYSRNAGNGCPYCANQAVLAGYNDLATRNPMLAAEWDYVRNHPLQPSDVGANSGRKVWWICRRHGHNWLATIRDRNSGSGCHVCAGKFIVSGANTLTTRFPEIAAQWDHEKNGNLSPDGIAPHSIRKIWWHCQKDHSWLAAVRNRTSGSDCPYCSGKAALAGYNDLASEKPMLAAEWDHEKNGMLTPEMVTASSGRIVWWRCSLGHSWHTSIAHRHRGSRCPYCSNRKVLKGFNDLTSTHPHLAAEWDGDKNGTVTPEDFCVGSTARAWWKCDKGHSWRAQIRTRTKYGCPYCASRMVLPGFNDLATTNPALAAQWDCEKNGALHPKVVSANSGTKAWWRCAQGHQWKATVASRNRGNGCPYCAGKAILPGYNDMLTVAPHLAAEWDYSRNKDLRPETLAITSRVKVWWRCSRGHSWKVAPFGRNKGSGCPYCAGKRPPILRILS
jgi:DNA-directed RNA polymerase subunit RPC12/RpoP